MHDILDHTHTVVHAYTLTYSMDNMYIYTYKMQCIAVLSLYTLLRESNTGNARERANSETLHITYVHICSQYMCVCVCVCVSKWSVCVCVI